MESRENTSGEEGMVTRARTGRQLRGSKRKSARMFRSFPPSFHELLSILRDNSVTFRFSPASPAKRNCAGKVSESYEFFKIPTQIKKRSNARFLSTLLRYLSSILTIYFCLRDNLGCPLTYSGTWIWRVHIIPHTTQNEKGKKDRHRPSLSGAGNMVNCAIITLIL